MPSGLRVPWHSIAFQTPSVRAYFFWTTSVKVCGVRTTPAMVYFFYTMRALAFAFEMQCFKAYFFLTTIVRAFAFWTQGAKAYLPMCGCASTFRMMLVSTYAAPNTRLQFICAPANDGHRISLRVDECQSIAFSSKLRMSRYVVSGRHLPWHLPPGRRIPWHMPFRCQVSGYISSR